MASITDSRRWAPVDVAGGFAVDLGVGYIITIKYVLQDGNGDLEIFKLMIRQYPAAL